jgi:hypothetical protein
MLKFVDAIFFILDLRAADYSVINHVKSILRYIIYVCSYCNGVRLISTVACYLLQLFVQFE